ncbi:MAG: Unknown protein [uncultured Sulfurovum sp.]|uniref:Lipoprotein n=1 Tax=uncultured Sulfurovum sp. TaxID=269237 RepID=A0A6S6U5V8_9BACT|nr:MAG: Unknown protein [uncultured Sulfurovum sp.]
MKSINLSLTISTVLATLVLSGCTPKTAGMDSAYLNANRGADGAQVSRAEAAQYRRQQALTADEIRLENMKRHQTTDSIQEGAGAAKSAVGAIQSVRGLFGF